MKKNSHKKTLIIAEVGLSHGGSLKVAKKLIEKIAEAGADVIKFQTHIASEESTLNEKFRKGHKFNFKSRYDYWKHHEFTETQWKFLSGYCYKKKIGFMSSPFSIKSVKILKKTNQKFWKIGSGEFFSQNLIREIIKLKKPIIVSTGLSNYEEIKKMVKLLKNKKSLFYIMQCTTKYPTSFKEIGLNVAHEIKKKFKCAVGLSDHSGSLFPALFAISNDEFEVIEVHVTLNKKDRNNPDNSSSITIDELKFLCEYNKSLETMKNNEVNKDSIAKKLIKTKKLFTKSIAPSKNLLKGHQIKSNDICLKKPGTGIQSNFINNVIGKVLKKNVKNNKLLKWSDFEK
tara:strand:+ start:2527 stop:3555 length:1029 start_codon:yes stop_codon:yes gene_type:complete